MNDKFDHVYNLRGDDFTLREILGAAVDVAALAVGMSLVVMLMLCM
jgi:hypothetical protein